MDVEVRAPALYLECLCSPNLALYRINSPGHLDEHVYRCSICGKYYAVPVQKVAARKIYAEEVEEHRLNEY
jgi:hypothetical protein